MHKNTNNIKKNPTERIIYTCSLVESKIANYFIRCRCMENLAWEICTNFALAAPKLTVWSELGCNPRPSLYPH